VNQNKDSALHIASKSGVVADVKTLIEKVRFFELDY